MAPAAVIDRQIAAQPAVSLLRVWDGHGIGPFLAEGLDKALGLAVGSGRVGPGADVPQPQGLAGPGERLGDVGRAVIAHHPAALDALAVEPGDGSAEEADHRWLLLIRQHLDVGQACGVIHSDMNLVVADAIGAPLLAITGDPVAHPAEAGQGFDVDVDQVAWPFPLVALHRRFGIHVPQSPQPKAAESPGDGGEGSLQQPGDVPEVESLVPEMHRLLELLRIERPPLGAAHARSAREVGPPER